MFKPKVCDHKIILFFILLLGFTLRIVGYRWGGNRTIFQPDEYTIVAPIIEMTENHCFIHGNWTYPAMCTSQIIAGILMHVSKIHSFDWIEYYYFVRIFYVLFSTAIIYLSYALVKECDNQNVALIFSFLIAINPILIKYSKQAVGDTPVMMFWILVALCMCKYIRCGQIRLLVMMSFFAACATMEKWNGAGVTLFIAVGVIYYNFHDIKKLLVHGITSFISWLLSVFIIAPKLITDFRNSLESIYSANPALGSSLIQGHLEFYFTYAGVGAIILLFAGIIRLIKTCDKERSDEKFITCIPILLAGISLVEDWMLCQQLVERHGLLFYWGCTLLIISGYFYLCSIEGAWKKLGMVLILLATVSWGLQSLIVDVVAVRTNGHDTREVALSYLNEIGATVDNSTGEFYTPFNPPYAEKTMETYDINEILYLDEQDKPCIRIPDTKYVIIGEYSWKDKSRPGYVVLREKGTLLKRYESGYDADLFMHFQGCGQWYYSELDIIRNAFGALSDAYLSETIGPWLEIYDVSEFEYKP